MPPNGEPSKSYFFVVRGGLAPVVYFWNANHVLFNINPQIQMGSAGHPSFVGLSAAGAIVFRISASCRANTCGKFGTAPLALIIYWL